jgi:hypothetical protein
MILVNSMYCISQDAELREVAWSLLTCMAGASPRYIVSFNTLATGETEGLWQCLKVRVSRWIIPSLRPCDEDHYEEPYKASQTAQILWGSII